MQCNELAGPMHVHIPVRRAWHADHAAAVITDADMMTAPIRFPYNTPKTKEVLARVANPYLLSRRLLV